MTSREDHQLSKWLGGSLHFCQVCCSSCAACAALRRRGARFSTLSALHGFRQAFPAVSGRSRLSSFAVEREQADWNRLIEGSFVEKETWRGRMNSAAEDMIRACQSTTPFMPLKLHRRASPGTAYQMCCMLLSLLQVKLSRLLPFL